MTRWQPHHLGHLREEKWVSNAAGKPIFRGPDPVAPFPAALAERSQVEESLTEDERATLRWTLTWLENRPIVELDNGVVLRG